VAQLVAHRADEAPQAYSLSCNPDLTLDLLARRRDGGIDFLYGRPDQFGIAVHARDAAIGENEFDVLLDGGRDGFFQLFACAAREPVGARRLCRWPPTRCEHSVPDCGTLQIGIGSLGEAVAQALVLAPARQRCVPHAAVAARLRSGSRRRGALGKIRLRPLRLLRIVRRRHARSVPRWHSQARSRRRRAARRFFSSARAAFTKLCARCHANVVQKFGMTAIGYGQRALSRRGQQTAGAKKCALPQRRHDGDRARRRDLRRPRRRPHRQARRRAILIFIAQSFALEDARSAIVLRATRTAKGRERSNILWRYGHTTSRATCAT